MQFQFKGEHVLNYNPQHHSIKQKSNFNEISSESLVVELLFLEITQKNMVVVSLAASTPIFSSTVSNLPRVPLCPPHVCGIASQKRRKTFNNPPCVAAPPSAPNAAASEEDQENVDPSIEIEDSEENSPSIFSWRHHWYPVSLVEDLDPRYPTPFQLLNRDLVLWFDNSASQWVAFDDKCPHRLAPLSEGRIDENGLCSVRTMAGRLMDAARAAGFLRRLLKGRGLVQLSRRGRVLQGFGPRFLKGFSVFGLMRKAGKGLKPPCLQSYWQKRWSKALTVQNGVKWTLGFCWYKR